MLNGNRLRGGGPPGAAGQAHVPKGPPAARAVLPLTLGLLCALPLLLHGAPSCGHDFDFHLQSWLAVRHAWRSGLPDPHWVPGANYGAGEPRFVFYPPLSWLLGASLGAILPWAWAPWAFTALCFAGAAAAMRSLAGRFCPPPQAALAAALYAAGPYLLFTGYERTAYGELLAAAWMPLLLAALLQPSLPVARTGLLLAALWYSDAPAGVMGSYLTLLALCWAALGARPPQAFRAALRHSAALALGGLLAADYLLPAWYEQRFVAIRRAVGPGMRIQDSFLFAHTGEPFHDAVLHTASSIAVATLLAGAFAGAWVLWRGPRASLPAPTRRAAGFSFLLLGLCGLLQLPLSGPVWQWLPELAFLQFPWRLLLPGSAAAALLLALAAPPVGARWKLAVVGALFAASLAAWAGLTRYQPCDEEDNPRAQLALSRSGAGFEGTDEYAPADTDNGEIQRGLPPVRLLRSPSADRGDDTDAPNPVWSATPQNSAPGAVRVEHWDAERREVRVRPAAGAYAVLRLERFPAWRVLLDGQPCGPRCVPRDDGLVTVQLPPARWSTIDARWRTQPDVWWARALSACGLLLLPWLGGRERPARARV